MNISQQYLVAMADFNADSFTDLITYHLTEKSLRLHLWQRKNFSFESDLYSRLLISNIEQPLNVIASDFDYNGILDLLLQYKDVARIYYGPDYTDSAFSIIHSNAETSQQLAMIDFNGDQVVDLFGLEKVWLNDAPANKSMTSVKLDEKFCKQHRDIAQSFVDLNGDCLADLFVICEDLSYQVWLNGNNGKFELHSVGSKLPDGTFSVRFADMNADGTMDAVISSCTNTFWSSSCSITIVYNRQKALCSAGIQSVTTNCRSMFSLCSADNSFELSQSHNSTTKFDLPYQFASTSKISTGSKYISPLIEDVNMDGFPDLFLVLKDSDASFARLFTNIACPGTDSSCLERTFTLRNDDAVKILSEYNRVEQVFLVDMDERGTFDIMLVNSNDAGKLELVAIFNNIYVDAFFLKVYTSNGVCHKNCDKQTQISTKPLATNYPGPTFKFTVLDPEGNKRSRVGAQLSQTTHGTIQPPFNLVGLGRTNNYIEEFFCGRPSISNNDVFQWMGLIPNSQLLIHPPTSIKADSRHSGWIMELFISPGDYAIYVLVVLLSGIIILGLIVAVLRLMERREDEEEKRKALHVINFDAL